MGKISFYGCIRKGSSGQTIITVPKKYRDIITVNKLCMIIISSRKEDMSIGEKIEYDK
jgi:hypothetical protein